MRPRNHDYPTAHPTHSVTKSRVLVSLVTPGELRSQWVYHRLENGWGVLRGLRGGDWARPTDDGCSWVERERCGLGLPSHGCLSLADLTGGTPEGVDVNPIFSCPLLSTAGRPVGSLLLKHTHVTPAPTPYRPYFSHCTVFIIHYVLWFRSYLFPETQVRAGEMAQ